MTARGSLSYERYFVGGHAEWLMRTGPEDGPVILFVPALFEEMNRTRAFMASVMRMLADEGFACLLPDLPGTGESERPLEACGWSDWVGAVQSLSEQTHSGSGTPLIVSLRGGALLADLPDAAHWRFAPAEGASLVRDLNRSGLVGGDNQAGYAIPGSIASGLQAALLFDPERCRTVRLASDPKPADVKLDGPALWRRSEPANSAELAQLSASDITAWARRCDPC